MNIRGKLLSKRVNRRNRSIKTTLWYVLKKRFEESPHSVAIEDGKVQVTYQRLVQDAISLSGSLIRLGLRPGDRLAICMPNSYLFVLAMIAVNRLGGVFVPINPLLKGRQLEHIIEDSQARFLLASSSVLDSIGFIGNSLPSVCHTLEDITHSDRYQEPLISVLPRSSRQLMVSVADDVAVVVYTSGTMGLQKGVMLTNRNLLTGAHVISSYLENRADDRILCLLPFSFTYGLSQLLTMLWVGGTVIMPDSMLPGNILQAIHGRQITGLAGVPLTWQLFLSTRNSLRNEPPSKLRYITNSGGLLAEPYLSELRRLMPQTHLYLMYGLTETLRSTYLPPTELKRGVKCIGRPVPLAEILVLTEDGEEAQPGEIGEIVHRGPTVALGYLPGANRRDESRRRTFRSASDARSNWPSSELVVFTGDLATKDDEGYLYFNGRRDSLIKTAGFRVSPEEIECLLADMPGLESAVAFGIPDSRLGQRVNVAVKPAPRATITPTEVQVWCRARGPAYLVPSKVHVIDNLPSTLNGKVDRQKVKERFSLAKPTS